MKYRINKKRLGISIILIVALIGLVIFFVSTIAETVQEEEYVEPTTYVNEIVYDESVDLDSDTKTAIEATMVEFLDAYYKSMTKLENQDMTVYFQGGSDNESALIYQTAQELLVEIRSMKHVDLKSTNATYDLEITEASVDGDTITLTVQEDSSIFFNFMADTETEIFNVENTFELVKVTSETETDTEVEYEIASYSKSQDFYVLVTDVYTEGNTDQLATIKADYLEKTETVVAELEEDRNYVIENGITSDVETTYEYDREAAYEYAMNWVDDRNPAWSEFDSNCQNFASQVLIAGGIPMDYTGSGEDNLQLKFYSETYNLNEEPIGYNYTWTYVPYFYDYAQNNTGVGLSATVDENIYFAEAGDIIQVGTTGYARHTTVSMGAYEVDGEIQDILLNSNTVDFKNFPLSAYTYPNVRLIKIQGYN